MLAGLKAAHCAPSRPSPLQPWDLEYYMAAARQQLAAVPRQQLAPYLHLGPCLQQLSSLLQQLMGLRLQQEELHQGEAWAPGIRKFQVGGWRQWWWWLAAVVALVVVLLVEVPHVQ
jgi:Zn-dependent oligopeptidase